MSQATANPAIKQYNEFFTAVNQTYTKLEKSMQSGLDKLARFPIPIPAAVIDPFVSKFNKAAADINGGLNDISAIGPTIQGYCSSILTLREAGEKWQNTWSAEYGYPLANAISREELESGGQFSWVSLGTQGYWSYIERNNQTANALAGFSDQIGASLIKLADAIDKQATELGWAIAGTIFSVIGAVGSGIALGATIGAVGGLPAGGVGALPGAVLGGIIGAIIGLVASIFGLIASIKAWVDATKIITEAATAELAQMETALRAANSDPWPAPLATGSGGSYQEP